MSRLVGAPPGYVGYEEGGQLTEAVRRRPYAVVLLDEIEKAHPDVFNILLQVLEDGRLTDGQGRTVDFTNTVLIMTSNLPGGPQRPSSSPSSSTASTRSCGSAPLTEEDLAVIVGIQLGTPADPLGRAAAVARGHRRRPRHWLAPPGYDPDFGARPLRRVIQREVEDPLALALLEGRYPEGSTVIVDVEGRRRRPALAAVRPDGRTCSGSPGVRRGIQCDRNPEH